MYTDSNGKEKYDEESAKSVNVSHPHPTLSLPHLGKLVWENSSVKP